jgi:hypothetical protein
VLFLRGGGSDVDLTHDVIKFLEQKGIKVEVSTMSEPEGFIYDPIEKLLYLNPPNNAFDVDWEKVRARMAVPLMQNDMLRKNSLMPSAF